VTNRWSQSPHSDGRKSFSRRDYRDLLTAAHQQLGGPIVLIRDNLNVHKAAGPRKFAEARDWLTIFCLPPCAPDLNPVEGIWSLLRRGRLSNVAFGNPDRLVRTVRRGLRHIQYRSHLMDGCLIEAGLTIAPARGSRATSRVQPRWVQEPPLDFLPAMPGIRQGASWRTCSARPCS
jgi:hypothetical protein